MPTSIACYASTVSSPSKVHDSILLMRPNPVVGYFPTFLSITMSVPSDVLPMVLRYLYDDSAEIEGSFGPRDWRIESDPAYPADCMDHIVALMCTCRFFYTLVYRLYAYIAQRRRCQRFQMSHRAAQLLLRIREPLYPGGTCNVCPLSPRGWAHTHQSCTNEQLTYFRTLGFPHKPYGRLVICDQHHTMSSYELREHCRMAGGEPGTATIATTCKHRHTEQHAERQATHT